MRLNPLDWLRLLALRRRRQKPRDDFLARLKRMHWHDVLQFDRGLRDWICMQDGRILRRVWTTKNHVIAKPEVRPVPNWNFL